MNWQWLAGFTDGDGCIEIKYDKDGLLLQTRVVWFQAEEPSNVLSHIKKFLEKNDVVLTERSFNGNDPQTREQTDSIHKQLSVNHEADVEFVLSRLYPYLIVKKTKAKKALAEIENVQQLRTKHGRNWKSYFKHGVGRIAVCAILMLVLFGATANMAQAKLKVCTTNMQAKAQLNCGKDVLHKHATAARWIKNHASRTIYAVTVPMSQQWRSRLKFHLWMVHRAHKWIKQAESRLRPTYSSGGIAHLRFWLCVHSGEGDSHPYYHHPWSGPLQMTSYWAGYPVYDWSTVPVSEVYADAEAQLQKHLRLGDVYTWIRGQWPNTSGSCLGYV